MFTCNVQAERSKIFYVTLFEDVNVKMKTTHDGVCK